MASDPYHHRAWANVRRSILERDLHRCQIAGPNCKGDATTVDHIISWQNGGAWFDPTNLRAACTTCNYGRTKYVVAATTYPEPSRQW